MKYHNMINGWWSLDMYKSVEIYERYGVSFEELVKKYNYNANTNIQNIIN